MKFVIKKLYILENCVVELIAVESRTNLNLLLEYALDDSSSGRDNRAALVLSLQDKVIYVHCVEVKVVLYGVELEIRLLKHKSLFCASNVDK